MKKTKVITKMPKVKKTHQPTTQLIKSLAAKLEDVVKRVNTVEEYFAKHEESGTTKGTANTVINPHKPEPTTLKELFSDNAFLSSNAYANGILGKQIFTSEGMTKLHAYLNGGIVPTEELAIIIAAKCKLMTAAHILNKGWKPRASCVGFVITQRDGLTGVQGHIIDENINNQVWFATSYAANLAGKLLGAETLALAIGEANTLL